MAFVVRRPAGRWEIRESVFTEAGPRARSLASFRVLTPDVLERAAQRATTPFDPAAVVAAARRAAATVEESAVDRAARDLLVAMREGSRPSRGLARLVVDRLEPREWSDPGGGIADWFDATDELRGETLREVLDLADALPQRRRGTLTFPGLRRTPAAARG
jgi:hypothetical protein